MNIQKYPYGVFAYNNRCCTMYILCMFVWFCMCDISSAGQWAQSTLHRVSNASLRQVCFSASSTLLRVKYASPRQVSFSASSTLLCVKYGSQRQVRFSASFFDVEKQKKFATFFIPLLALLNKGILSLSRLRLKNYVNCIFVDDLNEICVVFLLLAFTQKSMFLRTSSLPLPGRLVGPQH